MARNVHIDWHRHATDDQVVVAVAADEIRLALAFPTDRDRLDLETVLDELDRELDHFYGENPRRDRMSS